MRANRSSGERLLELAQRLGAQVRAVVRVHAAVVAVSAREMQLVPVEQDGLTTAHDRDLRDRGGGPGPMAEPPHDLGEPLGVDRLEQVVERLDRERLDRVLLVRGHEHELRRSGPTVHETSGVEPGEPGHLDVDEDHVVRNRSRELQRLGRARRLADDFDLRVGGEQVAQLRARGRLVVDEQRGSPPPPPPAPSRGEPGSPRAPSSSEVASAPPRNRSGAPPVPPAPSTRAHAAGTCSRTTVPKTPDFSRTPSP